MNKFMIVAATCLISSAALAGEVRITLGQFQPGSSYPDEATQFVTVSNGTDSTVNVEVECGFLRGPQLVGTADRWAINIPHGQNSHQELPTDVQGPAPDRAECRISQTTRSEAR
jgi:hypothetical protein